MKRGLRWVLLCTAVLTAATHSVRADLVFDNGEYSGPQNGRFNAGLFTIYEDFSLSSDTTITGFEWSQHDQAVDYTDTTISIFDALPSAESQIFSADIIASRTLNDKPPIFTNFLGIDYEIVGLSLDLGPGTYFFGMHNNVSGGQTTWDRTTGAADTIDGRWQSTAPPDPGDFLISENSVFQVHGDINFVPEPSSFALLSIGACATVLCAIRRRRLRRPRTIAGEDNSAVG